MVIPLTLVLMGIQHVCRTHKEDLDRSFGLVAIIVYFVDDIEFDKIRKFLEFCQLAKMMQPGYSFVDGSKGGGQEKR